MENDAARAYLASLLNKNLRISTADGRMFRGAFKCTDPDTNVVIAQTYEYRRPSAHSADKADGEDVTARYLGLVVVPGQHIVKMEVEEFASQMRGRAVV